MVGGRSTAVARVGRAGLVCRRCGAVGERIFVLAQSARSAQAITEGIQNDARRRVRSRIRDNNGQVMRGARRLLHVHVISAAQPAHEQRKSHIAKKPTWVRKERRETVVIDRRHWWAAEEGGAPSLCAQPLRLSDRRPTEATVGLSSAQFRAQQKGARRI